MKILIAYDGSESADAAIRDLHRAGMPADTEAEIVTISETFIGPDNEKQHTFADSLGLSVSESYKIELGASVEKRREAARINQLAVAEMKSRFPTWSISGEVRGGFSERAVLDEASKRQPDLIVVGSHGRGGLGRVFFGSVSLGLLAESKWSVRIGRRPAAREALDDSPLRILVAVDGSEGSKIAVEEVRRRNFPNDTSIRVVSAVEPMPYSILLADMPKAEALRNAAVASFREKGWHTSVVTQFGRAKDVILDEAAIWAADAVFIGARRHGIFERAFLGSVSYSVCARADCSVEVVRSNADDE